MTTPDDTARRYRRTGWLFYGAGAINLATHFSTQNGLFAAAALAFFAGGLFYFWKAKRS